MKRNTRMTNSNALVQGFPLLYKLLDKHMQKYVIINNISCDAGEFTEKTKIHLSEDTFMIVT